MWRAGRKFNQILLASKEDYYNNLYMERITKLD